MSNLVGDLERWGHLWLNQFPLLGVLIHKDARTAWTTKRFLSSNGLIHLLYIVTVGILEI